MQISSLSVFLCSLVLLGATVHTFVVVPTTVPSKTTTLLFATNKKKKKNSAKTSSGGFGGASMEPCPCGSSETYSRCCGKLHKDVNAYKTATAEQVARARYAAFAKKQPDFLMASTHPLHKDFNTDLKKWKESIK